MAKRKPQSTRLGKGLEPASGKAEEKIATLRKYYNIGLRALGKAPDGSKQEPESIKDLAKEAGVGTDTIRKAITFARAYNKGDLQRLLALRDRDGEPLGWYYVRVLIQVKDKAEREELQRETAEKGWSRDDLWDEISARHGGKRPTPRGGRRFAAPGPPSRPCGGWSSGASPGSGTARTSAANSACQAKSAAWRGSRTPGSRIW